MAKKLSPPLLFLNKAKRERERQQHERRRSPRKQAVSIRQWYKVSRKTHKIITVVRRAALLLVFHQLLLFFFFPLSFFILFSFSCFVLLYTEHTQYIYIYILSNLYIVSYVSFFFQFYPVFYIYIYILFSYFTALWFCYPNIFLYSETSPSTVAAIAHKTVCVAMATAAIRLYKDSSKKRIQYMFLTRNGRLLCSRSRNKSIVKRKEKDDQ